MEVVQLAVAKSAVQLITFLFFQLARDTGGLALGEIP
jgi:hypothetical protein